MSATFFLAIFMSSERSSNFLMRWSYFQLISALLHVSATVSKIAASKPDLDAKAEKDDFEAFFQRIFKRKITSAKVEKIC